MDTIPIDAGSLFWAVWIAAVALVLLVVFAWFIVYRLGEILDELKAARSRSASTPDAQPGP